MSFDIKLKGKEQKIKFNYMMLFKANKKLASKDKDGKSQNDGAGVLFVQVIEKEDDALINLLQLVDSKATENDVLEAVNGYINELVETGMNEEEAYNQIFLDLKEEMLASGFFVSKIRKYLENLEKVLTILESRKTEEDKIQSLELKKLVEKISKEIS
ncbi:hypothetical protein NGG16_02530 [Enterococcus casseliflavus]|uniref:hypothetical protein n=1 Tax=Enterococcus casseliflavus TaxID=37734 RepID=UPI002DB7F709|nr:hypothetical protein [Enterococcus casseliflavus]MEB8416310.1 hypothetical protein [Enterococcus casseliflavus]